MDEDRVVSFAALGWEDDVPGIRAKAASVEGERWAMVSYEEGARREEWCRDGHCGLVLEGAVEYEFEDGGEALTAREGDAFMLATGRGHRGRNLASGTTRLFLIDEASAPEG
jgi:quercetin dioxygenase-like cupin family protein